MDKQSALNLVWIDLEMTGLDPDIEVIIEIASLVTDHDLNILAEGPCLAIHQNDEILGRMDAWNQKHHRPGKFQIHGQHQRYSYLHPTVDSNISLHSKLMQHP